MRRSPFNLALALGALGCALAVLGLPTAALAQTDVTTARIGGQVTDESGAALPGATVECRNPETGQVVVETTEANGN